MSISYNNNTSATSTDQVQPIRLSNGQPSQGSALGITEPPSSQKTQENPIKPRITGGVDYLEASLWIGYSKANWEKMTAKLDEARAKAIEQRDRDESPRVPVELDSGDTVYIRANSIGRGIKCHYAIDFGQGCTLGIVNRRQFKESAPNMRLTMTSDPLMVHGHKQAWENAQGIIKALGGQIVRTNVSRLDVCVDMIGVHASELVALVRAGHVIGRANKARFHQEHWVDTGMDIGRETILRVYDKRLEAKGKADKLDILVARRWGGIIPEKATRVEFQLRTDKLKESCTGDDNSIENVFDKLPMICEYLCTKWIRLTETKVDRKNKNHQRAETAQLWNQVHELFQEWAGENTEPLLPPIKRSSSNPKALLEQAAGCLATFAARTVTQLNGVTVLAEIMRVLDPQKISDSAETKRSKLSYSTGLGVPIDLAAVPF